MQGKHECVVMIRRTADRCRRAVLLHLFFVLLLLPGCNGGQRGEVSGQVTLNGEPVENGMIAFIPTADRDAPSAWTKIIDGHYQIPAIQGPGVGPCRVEIRWAKKTGRQIPAVPPAGPVIEETREVVPQRYNLQSELEADIQAGENVADFKLIS